ncbi:uncharacterized protein [Nicotiana tomentosiformis]|uniref:uncharacterized protein n=1 Tax=Nicotiana tomentosiformis TaxID=4098 RepID=UPI00388C43D7
MGVVELSGVDLTTFQLTGMTYRWWQTYDASRSAGATPLTWSQFSDLFLREFILQTGRDELCSEFEQLRQCGMTMSEYAMRFTELSRHATTLVSTDRERVRRFIEGLTYNLRFGMAHELETETPFHQVVEIARRLECIRG